MTDRRMLLDVTEVTAEQDLPAGELGAWLDDMTRSLEEPRDMEVPCGSCTACCTSRYFVHIGAAETETLARVPAALRFPAPGAPGDQVMGFDEQGRCPMLRDERCTIYAHRPATCRRFDCRVFAAAGLDPSADEQPAMGAQVRRWRFDHAGPRARQRHAAVSAAARFLLEHGAQLGHHAPGNLTQVAVLAVRLHRTFEAAGLDAQGGGREPDPAALLEVARATLDAGPAAAGVSKHRVVR